jgi:putative acetyltransferase
MQLQAGVDQVRAEDYARVVEVWEASVRATHHFVAESDIEIFRPLVRGALPDVPQLACVRDAQGEVAGFIGISDGDIAMLFVHPDGRGQGIGRRLIRYAVDACGATTLDVNEQNEQALGFYLRMGFEVEGRSELDGMGKPYPLLHMRLKKTVLSAEC